jgi:hypothetical protein
MSSYVEEVLSFATPLSEEERKAVIRLIGKLVELRAQNERLRAALREIADAKSEEEYCLCMHIARKALGEGE